MEKRRAVRYTIREISRNFMEDLGCTAYEEWLTFLVIEDVKEEDLKDGEHICMWKVRKGKGENTK